MLAEKMSSLALNDFLEGGDPFAETSFTYEISVLKFIPPGEIGQI